MTDDSGPELTPAVIVCTGKGVEIAARAWAGERGCGCNYCASLGDAALNATHYAELTTHLRQLVKYSRFQINEGADYHPTLPSAVRAAEELLDKIGGDA